MLKDTLKIQTRAEIRGENEITGETDSHTQRFTIRRSIGR
jgi:hypothetical protein